MPQVRFQFGQQQASQHFQQWQQRVNAQPSWIARFAMTVVALIILIPILALIILALFVGLAVFIALVIANKVSSWFGNVGSARKQKDGRENVRVIIPEDE